MVAGMVADRGCQLRGTLHPTAGSETCSLPSGRSAQKISLLKRRPAISSFQPRCPLRLVGGAVFCGDKKSGYFLKKRLHIVEYHDITIIEIITK
jgi:hypothetical protein